MYTRGVWEYFKEALGLVFRRYFSIYFKILYFLFVNMLSFVFFILIPIKTMSTTAMYCSIIDTGTINFKDILKKISISTDKYLNILVISSLKNLILVTGMVLLVVPGIIFSLMLAPVSYVLATFKNPTTGTALADSMEKMKGNKLKYLGIIALFMLAVTAIFMTVGLLTTVATGGGSVLGGIIILVLLPPVWVAMGVAKTLFFRDVIGEEQPSFDEGFPQRQDGVQAPQFSYPPVSELSLDDM